MPYTLHQAETESQARSSPADLSWDYQAHQVIFGDEGVGLRALGFFYNLSDFYQDAVFLGTDVINLRAEVEEARQRIQHPKATEPLALLSKLCERVIHDRSNLFAFGE